MFSSSINASKRLIDRSTACSDFASPNLGFKNAKSEHAVLRSMSLFDALIDELNMEPPRGGAGRLLSTAERRSEGKWHVELPLQRDYLETVRQPNLHSFIRVIRVFRGHLPKRSLRRPRR